MFIDWSIVCCITSCIARPQCGFTVDRVVAAELFGKWISALSSATALHLAIHVQGVERPSGAFA
jgi:hypothetical protein